jgi:hypothetical protein
MTPGEEKFVVFLEVVNDLVVAVQQLTEQIALSNQLAMMRQQGQQQPQEPPIDLGFVVDLFNEFKKMRKGKR